MAVHDGKRVLKDSTGALFKVAAGDADAIAKARGLVDATDSEVSARSTQIRERAQYGTPGQLALGTAEKALRTATFGGFFGAVPEDPGSRQRARVIEETAPVLGFAAEAAGAFAPGAAAGRAAKGLGALRSAATEGLAAGAALEVESSTVQERPISAGNILLFGVGGELAGRALPALLRRGMAGISKATNPVAAVAGEAAENLAVKAEARALDRGARRAMDLPEGPARDAALLQSADKQFATATDELSDALTEGARRGDELLTVPPRKLESLVAPDAPVQVKWSVETATALDEMAKARPAGKAAPALDTSKAPVSLAGKTLDDLKALPLDQNDRAATLAGLRSSDEFARTGRAPRDVDKLGHDQGVTIVRESRRGKDPVIYLRDGRHRFSVAKEKDLESIWGTVVDARSGKQLYRGDIPLKVPAGKTGQLDKLSEQFAAMTGLQAKPRARRGAAAAADPVSDAMRKAASSLLDAEGGAGIFRAARAAEAELVAAGAPAQAVALVRDSLRRKDLWGKAAEFADDLAKVREKHGGAWGPLRGELSTGEALDASKVRALLELDATARGPAGERLVAAVSGLEDYVSMSRKWGLHSDKSLSALEKQATRARRAISLTDGVHAARARGPAAALAQTVIDPTPVRGNPVRGDVRSEIFESAADMAIGAIGLPPIAGVIRKLAPRIWNRIDDQAKAAVRNTARKIARPWVSPQSATERSVAAASALERFQGEYSDPMASFEAKKQILDELRINPTALPLALAASLGDLPQTDPKTYVAVAARVDSMFSYVQANLPTQVATSIRYPRGVPPSDSTLREFATVWNSTFFPDTVLDDLENQEATPLQMQALRDVHPDTYAGLQADLVTEVANSFEDMDPANLVYLDNMFQSDGFAGPAFSWRAADYIAEAEEDAMQKGMGKQGLAPKSASADADQLAPDASSLSAIRNTVTNRGA